MMLIFKFGITAYKNSTQLSLELSKWQISWWLPKRQAT